jgi:hypothetical protein
MNKHFYLLLFLCISYLGFAQTKGINYQAVIIDPTRIDIPAYDISAHPYVNKEVWLKFGIYSGTRLVYEEVQKTNTDAYGLVNLLIGTGLNTGLGGSFASIVWDGTILSLGTKISFNHGNSYTEISKQAFTYVPYAQYADVASKLSVVLPVSGGGTGATNAIAARANLGFGNIDNTADVDKPVSTATLAQLNNKESLANKSSDINADANSTVKYPTVKAIKEYVDARVGSTGTGPVTATKLASSININGVPFDGSMDITVAAEAGTLSGTVAILHGGTGATTATGALTNLRAESLDNKSTNIALDANSTAKYPSVKLIKDYVDTRVVSGGINDGSISSAKISDATIVDADVAANAAIAFPKLNIVKSDITGLGIQETLPSTTTTIGSTAMALGGTYSSITGLSSVTSTGFTGALIGNASTATALSTGRTQPEMSFIRVDRSTEQAM